MKGPTMKPLLKWTATSAACLAVIGAVLVVWPGTVSLPASEPAVTVSAPTDSPTDDTDVSGAESTNISGTGGTDTSGIGSTDTSGTGSTSADTSGGTDPSGSVGAPVSAPGDTYVESGSGGSVSDSGGTSSNSGGTSASHSDDTYAGTQDSHDDHDHGTPVRPAEPEHGAGHH